MYKRDFHKQWLNFALYINSAFCDGFINRRHQLQGAVTADIEMANMLLNVFYMPDTVLRVCVT